MGHCVLGNGHLTIARSVVLGLTLHPCRVVSHKCSQRKIKITLPLSEPEDADKGGHSQDL